MVFDKYSKQLGFYVSLIVLLWAGSTSLYAADRYFTASIDSKGQVMRQSPDWVGNVKHNPRTGYFSEYEVILKAGVFERAPGFCSVSVTDVESYDDLLFAHAKLAGTPTTRALKVVTQVTGNSAKDVGTSKSFMLMCVR
ncbi:MULTISPECIES: hypothetical protein [unclassified Pseudomonas]|uniref:Uncharacterized protein n=1 Tax=Pseudomonas sp. MYb327 TaxID=2745230 RepID=A0AAU8E2Q1_9PSED